MQILDTTFLIDLLRGDKSTLKRIESDEVALTTQINMYELIRGFFLEKAPSSNLAKAKELFENMRVLQLDDDAVIKSAEIFANLAKKGKIIADTDCIIAGIALSNGITKIVTKNAEHFKRIEGLTVETY